MAILTGTQFLILAIITEILLWNTIVQFLRTIQLCTIARAYAQAVSKNNIMLSYNDFSDNIKNISKNKEDKQNESE